MSCAWLPRRIVAGIQALPVVLILMGASQAAAQDPGGDPRAVNVIGSDAHARRCANAAASGVSTDQALDDCTRALAYARITREGVIQIRIDRGITYLRRHQGDEALGDFDAVLLLDPHQAEAQLNRGAALLMMHQPGPAVAAITQALSLGVSQPYKAYYNRGAAREALGDLRGAYEDYNTALEIEPDWPPAEEEIARFVRGRREHLATVLGQQPSTP